ncbi:Actin-fragmin kinase [Phytophthora nicotianae]|uniref:Actin-fragmin kinase n=1 Tax=Phytophthora nicotianae TaxID=4792 RepID=A0A0W8BXC0_PHYNI|nr:Actin-fragmin kinase [Phytophthora nicotianae]
MTSSEQPAWATVPCVNPREAPLIGSGHACAVRKGSLYIYGERNLPATPIRSSSVIRPTNSFYEFNFARKEWSTVLGNGVAPSQRKSHSAVVYKDSFYVFGGYDGDRRLNDFFSYNFCESVSLDYCVILAKTNMCCGNAVTQTWTNVFVNAGQQPTPRYGHAAVVYDNAMYIFGGSDSHYDRESMSSRSSSEYGRLDSGRHVNDMHSFNLETNSWSLIRTTGEVPYPREGASMIVYNQSCLLFGGYDHDLGYLNDVHVFNFGCHHPLVTLHNNSLIVFGGQTDPNLYELDLESNTWETIAYSGSSPKSNAPTGCVSDDNLIVLSEHNEAASFKQIHLPEKKTTSKTQEDLEPDEEGSAIAHLRSLVNNQLMSDVTFIVEGEPIFGHKSLCVRCNYFKAMFTGEMKESTAGEVEISDVSRATFLSLLEYVYTDRLAVADDDVKELFVAADRYGIESLKRLCAQKLLKSVNVDNVASILQAADQHNSPSLRDECFAFTLKNFDTVSKTPSFLDMARNNIELALQILQQR